MNSLDYYQGRLKQAIVRPPDYFGPREQGVSLKDYSELTFNFTLDPWQVGMCNILERCLTETGIRMLIHAPPQTGKSIIVSQRFPAWYIGHYPSARVVLTAYNEKHATRLFTKTVKELILAPEYAQTFGVQNVHGDYDLEPMGLNLRSDCAEGAFSVGGRIAQADGQMSITANGLLTGFVGKGAELLIVDDPYASFEEAFSTAINERIWRWWTGTASVRIKPSANVIIMFHRYQADDFVGRLIEESGIPWEYYRHPAIAEDPAELAALIEDDPDIEKQLGVDPTGRKPGEVLGSQWPLSFYTKLAEDDPHTFLALHQGRPTDDDGTLISVKNIDVVHATPIFEHTFRAWDIALTDGRNDYTVGVLAGMDAAGVIYILDIWRGRKTGPDVRKAILHFAEADPIGTYCCVEESTASLSIIQDLMNSSIFFKFPLIPVGVAGRDKYQRALGWINRAEMGLIKFVAGWAEGRSEWVQPTFREFRSFKNQPTDTDDIVDAFSVLFHGLYQTQGGLKRMQLPVDRNSPEYFRLLAKDQGTGIGYSHAN